MWKATELGFYSILQSFDNKRLLMFQAGVEKDLFNLKAGSVSCKIRKFTVQLWPESNKLREKQRLIPRFPRNSQPAPRNNL